MEDNHVLIRIKVIKAMNNSNKLIRIKAVLKLTGLSRSYIYQLADKGLFPQSIQLVPGGLSVAWVEQEVLDWIDSRIQERNDEVALMSTSSNAVITATITNHK